MIYGEYIFPFRFGEISKSHGIYNINFDSLKKIGFNKYYVIQINNEYKIENNKIIFNEDYILSYLKQIELDGLYLILVIKSTCRVFYDFGKNLIEKHMLESDLISLSVNEWVIKEILE